MKQRARPLQPMELRNLTYGALPWQTHPIDLASGSQGWGPFAGPWQPVDFASPAMSMGAGGIDITWNKGDNRIRVAPPYQVATYYRDNATSLVNNRGPQPVFQPSALGASTITQGAMAGNANPRSTRFGGAMKMLQTIFQKG